MKALTRNDVRSFRLGITRLRIGSLVFGVVGALAACSPSTPAVDFGPLPPDMTVKDLSASKTCGDMMLCLLTCGLGKPSCDISCAIGVNSDELLKATALGVCAVLNCASGDMGTGGYGALTCLARNCPSEVAACNGLPH